MEKEIKGFNGEYICLNNQYASPIIYDGILYPTVEHAYQASKTMDIQKRKEISLAWTSECAKKLGHQLTIRDNWQDIKVPIMRELLILKFTTHNLLKSKLLETGDKILIAESGNDTFWGVNQGIGENHLGELLMEVRTILK